MPVLETAVHPRQEGSRIGHNKSKTAATATSHPAILSLSSQSPSLDCASKPERRFRTRRRNPRAAAIVDRHVQPLQFNIRIAVQILKALTVRTARMFQSPYAMKTIILPRRLRPIILETILEVKNGLSASAKEYLDPTHHLAVPLQALCALTKDDWKILHNQPEGVKQQHTALSAQHWRTQTHRLLTLIRFWLD